MPETTHITTSSGLISAAFIENIREPCSRQRGTTEGLAFPTLEVCYTIRHEINP